MDIERLLPLAMILPPTAVLTFLAWFFQAATLPRPY